MDILSLSNLHQERRAGFRMPVPACQQPVELRDGNTSLMADCLDQSVSGFGVFCVDPFPWSVGGLLRLKKDDTWHEVEVVRIQKETSGSRIGLHRLGDCDVCPEPRGLKMVWGVLRGVFGFRPLIRLQVMGLLWPFLCVFVLCFVVLVIALHANFLSGDSATRLRSTAGSSQVSQRQTRRPAGQPRETGRRARTLIESPERTLSGLPKRQAADKLTLEPVQLSWLDIERQLGMSPAQSEQLLGLLMGDTATTTVGELDRTMVVVQDPRQLAAAVIALPDASLSFLTEGQQKQLHAMADVWSRQ